MTALVKQTKVLLAVGDAIVFYIALLLTLIIRYDGLSTDLVRLHLAPFTALCALWLLLFYMSGLYDIRLLRNTISFQKLFLSTILLATSISITLFYLGIFGITPKTNLAIFVALFSIIAYGWRHITNRSLSRRTPITVLLIGANKDSETTAEYVATNPQLGYRIERYPQVKDDSYSFDALTAHITDRRIDAIVIPRSVKWNPQAAKAIYKLFSLGAEIFDFSSFYELIFEKVPLHEIEELWLLENVRHKHRLYRIVKRSIDVILAAIFFLITLPLWIPIGLLIKLTSRGPIVYAHERVGEKGKLFTLYKFRSMVANTAHRWPEKNDERITSIGKILRRTHLDELPQLINILKGEVSFVGPRPDFVEFFKVISQQIPYYTIRTLARPGMSGWAQINYPTTASLEETRERLAYDLYYLKNASFLLDIRIMLKTLKIILTASGR